MEPNGVVKKIDFLNLAPYVRFAHEDAGEDDYRVPPRIIYDHEMILITSGTCVFQLEDQTYPLEAGDLLFIRPHLRHSYFVPKGKSFRYFAVHFDLMYMGEQLDFSPIDVYVNLDYFNMEYIPVEEELAERPLLELDDVWFPHRMRVSDLLTYTQIFQRLVHTFTSKPVGYPILLRSQLLLILSNMANDLATDHGVSSQSARRTEITETIRHMQNHYADPLELHALSQAGSLSPNYFRKLFKEATGRTPLEFLTHLRIEKAKELLQAGTHSISKISAMVGYEDIHYFSKLFKKLEGMSPKNYAASLRRAYQE
ncbi:AraC family transcriptional regulator [Paenibacillus qinlingensis]|uniref:AraC-like DNA-binding protein n=1 Tax=Paenibacillus qinlingensis TaxID=1837343 RepID=A0ABU1P1A7_9BACL|nr:AraC family transcriptional regulator [Paenibacillus qinlingensis]MDR6553531.1 AraC-like DNA-binding protein [Paenibacillus qinlingensis]